MRWGAELAKREVGGEGGKVLCVCVCVCRVAHDLMWRQLCVVQ